MNFPNVIPQKRQSFFFFFLSILSVISRCSLVEIKEKMLGHRTVQIFLKVKIAQWCPTLRDPMDYTVHGILQARLLECVAFLFSRESSQPRDRTQFCIAGGFFTNWAIREASNCFPKWLYHYIFLAAVYKSSSFYTHSSTPSVVYLFHFGHSK